MKAVTKYKGYSIVEMEFFGRVSYWVLEENDIVYPSDTLEELKDFIDNYLNNNTHQG